jgi:polyferredoxin
MLVRRQMSGVSRSNALIIVKVAHTIVWAALIGCILAIPVASWRGEYRIAAMLAAIVAVEAVVLIFNGWVCPLTSVAARYTDDRRPNFDIYLPEWLAKHNKLIFGMLYVAGSAFALARWAGVPV